MDAAVAQRMRTSYTAATGQMAWRGGGGGSCLEEFSFSREVCDALAGRLALGARHSERLGALVQRALVCNHCSVGLRGQDGEEEMRSVSATLSCDPSQ